MFIRSRLAALVLTPMLVAYATGQGATVTGTVRDSSGAVVVAATISIIQQENGTQRSSTSNAHGIYHFSFLPSGLYHVEVSAPGFANSNRLGIRVYPDEDLRLDCTLLPAVVKQSVVVNTTTWTVQTDSSTLVTNIDAQLVHDLPLNGRTFQSLLALAPGVVRPGILNQFEPQTGTFITGQRNNYFTVDGVSASVAGTGGHDLVSTVLGTTHNLVSVDDMQEFTLQRSTYSAAYGRASGGQVDVVTRSGTNTLHGALFDYFRNEALDANDWFTNFYGLTEAAHRQNDFGATFGGPITRNRAFFFLSYESLRLALPFTFRNEVPSDRARQIATGAVKQLLNAFPLANGPEDVGTMTAAYSGTSSNHVSADNGSIRIDDRLTDRVHIFGRYTEAASKSNSTFGLGWAETDFANFRSATVGLTMYTSASISTDLRSNYSRNANGGTFDFDPTGGAIAPPTSLLFPAPFASRKSSLFVLTGLPRIFKLGQMANNVQQQGTVVSNSTIVQGTHQIGFGIDYRYLPNHYGPFSYRQRISFDGIHGALSGIAQDVQIQTFDSVTLSFQDLAIYSQDTWRANGRLTLSYGLRWEINPAPQARGHQKLSTLQGLPSLSKLHLAPFGTSLYEISYTNFAPRLGFAYQLLRNPGQETLLRGGFGLVFDLGVGNIGDVASSFPHLRVSEAEAVPFPLSPQVAAPRTLNQDPPYSGLFTVFPPDHQLPKTYQWNITLDRAFGVAQLLSTSYVGAAGRGLLRENTFFDPNPLFSNAQINVTTNGSSSDYHALQMQFRRRMSRRLASLLSYTWSHSFDDTSNDLGNDNLTDPRSDRGASSFDVRHAFNAAFTYDIPAPGTRTLARILGNWSIDGILTARTAQPINVFLDLVDVGILDSDLLQSRPDRIPGVPLYLHDRTVPGERKVNPAAFTVPPELRQGSLERNSVRGFPLYQFDFGIRRLFALRNDLRLEFRSEFFNLFNHPNFGLIDGSIGIGGIGGTAFQPDPTFGIAVSMLAQTSDVNALYSAGGPRSIQMSLRLVF